MSGERFEVDAKAAEVMGRALASVTSPAAEADVAAARAAGEAVRAVIDRLTATTAPPEVLAEATARLAEVEALLHPYESVREYQGSAEASGLAHDRAFFDWSPLLGLSNPLAPPLHVSVEEDTIVARACFGLAYEGPPGCVHGGYVAAAFDEVLGLTQSLSGRVGMTGTLTVRYRKPTPLHTDLRFEGRVESVEGRKLLTTGRLLDGDTLTAEATGLFVTITPEHFRANATHRQRPGV